MAQKKTDKDVLIKEGRSIRMVTFFRGGTYKLIMQDIETMHLENDATWLRIAAKEYLRSKGLLK